MSGWGDWYDDDELDLFGGDDLPDIPSLTEEVQKNCYHKWVITGYGPNKKDTDPWENCEKCGMKKEDYLEKKKPEPSNSRFLF